MATHATQGPGMDYQQHDRTYATFLEMTKLGIVAVLNVVLVLLMVGFISGGLSAVFLVLTLLAVAAGFLMNMSWIPSGLVFGLASLVCLFSLAA